MSEKILYIQGVVTESELADLKRIAGTDSTKDAITYAVEKVIENHKKQKPMGKAEAGGVI